jgi:hypothetical protein
MEGIIMERTTDLSDLVKRLNQAQITRFVNSGKTLQEFLNRDDELLITESIAVLTKLMKVHPTVNFTW